MSNTTIQLKKSGQSGNTPADLNYGEVAINYADGKLFYKNGVGIKSIENQKTFSTINANNSLIIATTPTDILSLVAGSNITINSNTTTKTVTINSISDDTVAFAAYAQANTAAANTVYLNAVNDLQNTNITSVNTFTQAAYNKANNALANTSGAIFDGELLIGGGGKLTVSAVGGDEGGEILLGKAASNTTLDGVGVTIDVYQNRLRFFEQGGSARGFYLDISTGGGGATTNIMSGGGGGSDTVAFAAYAQANTASANTVYLQTVNNNQNTNISSANALAQAAFDAANTAQATPNVIGISSSGTYYPIFVDSNNAVATAESLYTDGGLSYDPSTNFLTAGFFIGPISGTTGSFSSYVQVTGDNDYVGWGANSDARMMYDGTANTINLQMRFDATSFDIDYFNGVTSNNKFIFYRANGDLQIVDGGITFRDGTRQNTETLSIASAAFNTANTAAANTVYLQTINDNQNTSITNVNTFTQAAYNTANLKFNTSGGSITGNTTIQQNLVVEGDLSVLGNSVTIGTSSLVVEDSLIFLANGNITTDAVDIGIVGQYNPGSGLEHTGIFRDPNLKEWILFQGYTPEILSNTLINFSNPSFRYANLYANVVKSNVISSYIRVNGLDVNNTMTNAWNTANNGVTLATAAYNAANTAAANTVYLQTINNNQNTSISAINTLALAAYGKANAEGEINNTQNTNITSVNTFAGSAFNTANAGVTLATAAYGQANAANTLATSAYQAGNTNATNITNVNTFTQAAYNKANGAVQTGFTTISANSVSITPTSNTDTLTITPGTNISISACTTTKTVTISSTSSGGSGTVTSVSGTGTASGLTLSGTVTTSGSLTLSGTVNSLATASNYQVNSLGVGTAASGTAGEIRATNNITAYYSDKRLKNNIITIPEAIKKVSAIRGVYYNSNETAEKYGYIDKEQQVGVLAQEIQQVLPHAVKPAPFDTDFDENGKMYSKSGENYLTVQYEKLIPLLIEAIKELQGQIDELKSKI
jgi:hypothetical protein